MHTIIIRREIATAPEPVPVEGPKKPAYGAPCNGCGVCCVSEPCGVILMVSPDLRYLPGPCPELKWKDGRSWCGLMLDACSGAAMREVMGDGSCDAGPSKEERARGARDRFEGKTASDAEQVPTARDALANILLLAALFR